MMHPAPDHQALRSEISFFGACLGNIIQAISGSSALELVEKVRRLAWDRRQDKLESGAELRSLIAGLDHDQLRIVIRSFTIFLDLNNLAEDRQRIRVLHARSRDSTAESPRGESINSGLAALEQAGCDTATVQKLLESINVELVFTAHPTDAKRRSVRSKLRFLRQRLATCDSLVSNVDQDRHREMIETELAKLWLTDFIRPWRPNVLHEVKRGLSIKPVLWAEVPRILRDLRTSALEVFGLEVPAACKPLTFGSWIGGDRDGHPGVTPDVTRQTFIWLRDACMNLHQETCRHLFDSLSISERQLHHKRFLSDALKTAIDQWPALLNKTDEIPPSELARKWLAVIAWRLELTAQRKLAIDSAGDASGCYKHPSQLAADLTVLRDAIIGSPGGNLIVSEVQAWLDQIAAFGFHLAQLDVRQDSRQYKAAICEILRQAGLCADPQSLNESDLQSVLEDTLDIEAVLDPAQLSTATQQALELFELLHEVVVAFGPEHLGGHVISMTHSFNDVLTVLWLWKHTGQRLGPTQELAHALRIIPLFETIDDLQRAANIVAQALSCEAYRLFLESQSDKQIIMLGYSDSTKDGGYLSACWALYRAQQELVEIAGQRGIELVFFHGRGGSLGRGGGPAARSILSLPPGTFRGALRLTEQGEVLADRYDDPAIANRHLEQMLWSTLLAAGVSKSAQPVSNEPVSQPLAARSLMSELANRSHAAYRGLVESPGFVDFFRQVTPIAEIEQLPIGSRPARRRSGGGLQDLRAIPWVFAWTQCRCLIPAWFGLGSAMTPWMDEAARWSQLKSLYVEWPFFKATIDNAELALAKTDIRIANDYFDLAAADSSSHELAKAILAEFEKSRTAVLALTGSQQLLDGTPWLQESIRIRNRFVDPLNLIQIDLLRRAQWQSSNAATDEQEEIRHLTRLSVNGIAAGLRTSG